MSPSEQTRSEPSEKKGIHGLAPIVGEQPHILILGSMPGAQSLASQQYYAHSGNAFWKVMERLGIAKTSDAYTVRTQQLKDESVALWDALQSCERASSMDKDIVPSSEAGNDFVSFLTEHRTIHAIFFNGAKAEEAFRRHALPAIQAAGLPVPLLMRLPSTSPAHAVSLAQKVDAWRAILGEF